jgi:hypothetical protein
MLIVLYNDSVVEMHLFVNSSRLFQKQAATEKCREHSLYGSKTFSVIAQNWDNQHVPSQWNLKWGILARWD